MPVMPKTKMTAVLGQVVAAEEEKVHQNMHCKHKSINHKRD